MTTPFLTSILTKTMSSASFACVTLVAGGLLLADTQQSLAANDKARSILKNTILENGRQGIGHNKRYAYKRTGELVRRGKRAQRFEIRHGDCGRSKGWDDCLNDRGRIERKENPKNRFAGKSRQVWIGFSVFVPADYTPLAGRALTSIIQTKLQGQNMPAWQLFLHNAPRVTFSDDTSCTLGGLAAWRGRWNDVTIFADYTASGEDNYFQLFKDGRRLCQRRQPIVNQAVADSRTGTYLKYGIYNAFVSRHLAKTGTVPKHFVKNNAASDKLHWGYRSVKSPYDHDWKAEVPTRVLYFDEMLAGQTRDAVDVEMREAAGKRPVD